MAAARFRLKTGDFEVEMEGEQEYIDRKFSELSSGMLNGNQGIQQHVCQQVEQARSCSLEGVIRKPDLESIVEYGVDGKPRLTVANPATSLSLSEIMTIFMYACEPRKLSLAELKDLVSDNWKATEITAVSAVMASTLKGRVIKDGNRGKFVYSLSGAGKEFVKNTIIRFKGPIGNAYAHGRLP